MGSKIEWRGPIKKYAAQWISDIDHEEPKSTSTKYNYEICAKRLSNWMEVHGIHDPDIDVDAVRKFQLHIESKYSRRAASYTCGRLAQLYDWMLDQGVVTNNPFRSKRALYRVGKTEKQEEFYRREERCEIARIALEKYEADPDAFFERALVGLDEFDFARQRFVFEFAIHTGLRIGELIRARVGDLNRQNRFLRVAVAKSSSRHVPMLFAKEALRRWLPVLQARFGSGPDVPLIPRLNGMPYHSILPVRKMILECLRALGVREPRVGPHTLRHLFHTRLQVMGVPPQVISAITGNSVQVQVSHYTHHIPPEMIESTVRTAIQRSRTTTPSKRRKRK